MRDDARPQDGFSWTRPRVPFGDDAFVWHDPATLTEGGAPAPANDARPPRQPRPDRAQPQAASSEAAPVLDAAPVAAVSTDEMWVELPAEAEPRKGRARKPRGAKAAPAVEVAPELEVVEAVAEVVVEAPVEAAPEPEPEAAPVKKPRSRAKAKPTPEPETVAVEPEPAPKPVVIAPEPAPVAAEPDPAEISAPPEKPKRGWWRRG